MQTQLIHRADGRHEIKRNFNDDFQVTIGDPLSSEATIVWNEDIQNLPYVRVAFAATCNTRSNRLSLKSGGRIVGYATLHDRVPVDRRTGKFTRRVFFMKDHDAAVAMASKAIPPGEVVDPKTVLPGVDGLPPSLGTANGDFLAIDSKALAAKQRELNTVLNWIDDTERPRDLHAMLAHSDRKKLGANYKGCYGQLRPVDGSAPIPLLYDELNIGRHTDCEVVIPFANIEPVHCRLSLELGYWFVRDLGSANDVRVNGKHIPGSAQTRLDPNSTLELAKSGFRVRYRPKPGPVPPFVLD